MARAIDADKLKKELAPYEENDFSQQIDVILKIVDMQPTLTPPNEPLTLEQLREMDGEPVWLEIAGGVWGLIDTDDGCAWLNRGGSIDINKLDGKVYRRPPEGEA